MHTEKFLNLHSNQNQKPTYLVVGSRLEQARSKLAAHSTSAENNKLARSKLAAHSTSAASKLAHSMLAASNKSALDTAAGSLSKNG